MANVRAKLEKRMFTTYNVRLNINSFIKLFMYDIDVKRHNKVYVELKEPPEMSSYDNQMNLFICNGQSDVCLISGRASQLLGLV